MRFLGTFQSYSSAVSNWPSFLMGQLPSVSSYTYNHLQATATIPIHRHTAWTSLAVMHSASCLGPLDEHSMKCYHSRNHFKKQNICKCSGLMQLLKLWKLLGNVFIFEWRRQWRSTVVNTSRGSWCVNNWNTTLDFTLWWQHNPSLRISNLIGKEMHHFHILTHKPR